MIGLAVHADWSMDPRRRWMSCARPAGPGRWHVEAPEPVGVLASLADRLHGRAGGLAVALGVDFPLGLPRDYVAAHRSEPDFPTFLAGLTPASAFFVPCETLAEIGPARPFFPARFTPGVSRAAHAAALGLGHATALSRHCDRATALRPAGAPLFWTLGANQTGKAAITAWRDLLGPLLAETGRAKAGLAETGLAKAGRAAAPRLRLWPFEGDFRALLRPGAVVVAETYPAEAMRQLGLRLAGSKRRQADRAALAGALMQCMAEAGATASDGLRTAIQCGFAPEHGGDDGFDSLLGVLCVVAVIDGKRPDTIPEHDPWLRRWEGWVLGQTDRPHG